MEKRQNVGTKSAFTPKFIVLGSLGLYPSSGWAQEQIATLQLVLEMESNKNEGGGYENWVKNRQPDDWCIKIFNGSQDNICLSLHDVQEYNYKVRTLLEKRFF